jgi:excisionase family DNA binding protein
MGLVVLDSVQPDEHAQAVAGSALTRVRSYLAHHPTGPDDVRIQVDDAEDAGELIIPRAAVELFARILAHMAAGQAVAVVPANAELTTQQAADLLNVSRPYLVKLLDGGEIAFRKVGTHRRVLFSSLMDYLRRDDQQRRASADELSALTQEMGLT